VFIGLPGGIDGLVHLSDLSWSVRPAKKPSATSRRATKSRQSCSAIDTDKERISLGIKQLEGDPYTSFIATHEKNAIVRCTVKSVDARGAVMTLDGDVEGYLRASEFSRDRIDDLSQGVKVGDVRSHDHQRGSQDPWHQPVDQGQGQAEQHEAMQKIAADNAASGTTNLGALLKAKLNNQG
jgi:small subunit ribosomal protein S1